MDLGEDPTEAPASGGQRGPLAGQAGADHEDVVRGRAHGGRARRPHPAAEQTLSAKPVTASTFDRIRSPRRPAKLDDLLVAEGAAQLAADTTRRSCRRDALGPQGRGDPALQAPAQDDRGGPAARRRR